MYCRDKNEEQFWFETIKESDHSEDLGVGGKLLLNCRFFPFQDRVR
jgi:hypothetical protein